MRLRTSPCSHARGAEFQRGRQRASIPDGFAAFRNRRIIGDDPDALALYRAAMTGEPGAHHYNVMKRNSVQGNSRAYTLQRRVAGC